MLDLARHFSRFIEADPERIHLAAHSHHYWPDVTFAAQAQCLGRRGAPRGREVGARSSPTLIPAVQAGIARILDLPDPATHRGRAEHPRLPAPAPVGPAGRAGRAAS